MTRRLRSWRQIPPGLVALVVTASALVAALAVGAPTFAPTAPGSARYAMAGDTSGLAGSSITYVPHQGCASIKWELSTSQPPYMTWEGSYHQFGTWRIGNGCGAFYYRSLGQAFEGSACTDARLVVLGTDWVVDKITAWRTACGGQAPAILATVEPGGVRVNDRFYVQCRDHDPDGRQPGLHCLYRITF